MLLQDPGILTDTLFQMNTAVLLETTLGSDPLYRLINIPESSLNLGPGSFGDFYKTAPGYTVSLGVVFKTGQNLSFNIRGVYQNDTNGDNSVTARFGLNFGF